MSMFISDWVGLAYLLQRDC